MHDVVYYHGKKHKRCIENIQEYLVREEEPVLSHDVFDNSKDRPDQDTDTGNVESPEVSFPWNVWRHGAGCGQQLYAVVEGTGDDDEESKKEDLDAQTGGDYVLAEGRVFSIAGGENSTTL